MSAAEYYKIKDGGIRPIDAGTTRRRLVARRAITSASIGTAILLDVKHVGN